MPHSRTLARTLAFLPFLAGALSLRAEHLPGGSITYECLGGNQHVVRLTLYRECSGQPMIPQTLNFSNDCGVQFTLSDLQPITVEDVSQQCESALAQNTCNGGPLIGVERYTYERTLFLSPCNSWTISWAVCCRAASVNVENEPGLYLETRLNNTGGSCNTSPTPNERNTPFLCVDQPVAFDGGATDPNGDVLRYRLIDARFGAPAPTPVNYIVPNYGGEPAPGMVIDTLTGLITFTPTEIGRIITVVQVDEYRSDGSYIGSVMHDFNFIVAACSNAQPDRDAGTVDMVSGAAEIITGDRLRVCTSGSFCASLTFTDPDPGQALEVTSNVATALPGSTLEITGTNPVTVTICWTAVELNLGEVVMSFTVRDDACPVRGQQGYAVVVDLLAPPNAGEPGTASYCTLTAPFALLDSLAGAPSPGGTWTGPDGGSMNGTFSPGISANGNYIYTTVLFPGCVATASVLAQELPADDPACILLGTGGVSGPALPTVTQVGRELWITDLPQGVHHLQLISTDGRQLGDEWTYGGSQLYLPLPETLAAGPILVRVMDGQGMRHVLRVAIFR